MGALEYNVMRNELLPGQDPIHVPKDWVELTSDWESSTGLPEEGSVAQYRDGQPHYHGHGDHYTVHIGRVDPDKDSSAT